MDYKSTSQKTEGREITLNGSWKEGIRRQMDIYVWVLKRKGFDVSNTGFFLYCDGDRFTDYTFLSEEIANMKFKITWLPYEVVKESDYVVALDTPEIPLNRSKPNKKLMVI